MGSTLSRRDDAAIMMDTPPPLLADITAGAKNVAASATTAAKVGVIAASLPLGFGGVAKRGGGL
jgi:hypothetical protein